MSKQEAQAKFTPEELWKKIQENKARIHQLEKMVVELTQDAQDAIANINGKIETHNHHSMTGKIYYTDPVPKNPERGIKGGDDE